MFKKKPKNDIASFIKEKLGVKIKKTSLFEQAFTHKSISREKNNERLEFLGDSILSAIVTSFLHDNFPNKTEGDLSKLTAKIVNRQHLNKLGEELNLIEHIKIVNHPKGNQNVLGNTLEALVGAVFIELGFDTTKKVMLRVLKKYVSIKEIDKANEDYKSQLLIWSQKNQKKIEFSYKKYFKSDTFEVVLKIDKKKIISAKATSKKRAENEAAKKAMEMFPTIIAK
jgi:ribonuclease-3